HACVVPRAGALASAARRLRLPVLQPAPGADRGPERRAAATADRALPGGTPEARRGRARPGRARRSRRPLPRAALGRAGATGRDRARDRQRSHAAPLRRADGRPRPADGGRDPRSHRRAQRPPRQDRDHGDPRSARGRARGTRPAHGQGDARRGAGVMKYLHLLWRNLMRRKIRTTFTFLSIAVAFFLFGLLMAIRTGFGVGIELAGQRRLLTVHKMSMIQPLPFRYLAQIQATPGVRFATHLTWFGRVYQDPKNFFANMAVDPEGLLRIYPEFLVDDDDRRRWVDTRTGALVGQKLAARFGWKVGDRIPIQPTFFRPRDGKPDTFEL